MPCPSAILAVWSSAWLAGHAAPDDALDALVPWAATHDVRAADEAGAARTGLASPRSPVTTLTSVASLLAGVRRAGMQSARLVLTAPGDVRGLPGPGPFATAATGAGEGVLFVPGTEDAGSLGAAPTRIADGVVRWTVFDVPGPVRPVEYVPVREAEHELREQVRRSTSLLTELGVARHRRGVREEIAAMLRARPQAQWPAGMPPAALRVLQQADEVEAILAAALADAPGGAVSASAAAGRQEALRPLQTAIRVARRAAVAAYSPAGAERR